MAKLIDYNVEDVEASGGGTGEKAPIGVYVAKIMLCEARDKKADGTAIDDIRVGLSVGEKFDWLFSYIGLPGSTTEWKFAEFIRALAMKEKGKFDTAKQVGKLIRLKVNSGVYEGAYSPDAGRMMKAQPGDEWGQKIGAIASAAAEASEEPGDSDPPESGDDDQVTGESLYASTDPNFTPSREGEEGIGSYDDWSDEDVEAEVDDRGVTVPGGRGNKRDKMVIALREDDSDFSESIGKYGDGAEPSAEPEAEATAGVVEDDYDDWDLEKLKEEWSAREMGDLPAIRGRNAADRLKAAIIEGVRQDDTDNPFQG